MTQLKFKGKYIVSFTSPPLHNCLDLIEICTTVFAIYVKKKKDEIFTVV